MLHVAPPEIRLLSSNILLMKKRNPLVNSFFSDLTGQIVRLNISKEERNKIIEVLLDELNHEYDYGKVLALSLRVGAEKMLGIKKKSSPNILNKPKSKICTDLIAYTIMEHSPKMKALIQKNFNKLDISHYDSFSPDDFWVYREFSGLIV